MVCWRAALSADGCSGAGCGARFASRGALSAGAPEGGASVWAGVAGGRGAADGDEDEDGGGGIETDGGGTDGEVETAGDDVAGGGIETDGDGDGDAAGGRETAGDGADGADEVDGGGMSICFLGRVHDVFFSFLLM